MKSNHRQKIFLGSFLVFAASLVGFGYFLYFQFIYLPPSHSDSTPIIYEVLPQKSFVDIAKELEQKGLIKNAKFFNLFAKLSGTRSHIKVGEYEFKPDLLPHQIMNILTSGKSIQKKFTVTEGQNIFEIAQNFETQNFGSKDEFIAQAHDRQMIQSLLGEDISSLEGYLYPETYMITKYMGAKEVIKQMVQSYLNTYKNISIPDTYKSWSRHQITTLASIVEKETGAQEERPLISSVFHNRLQKKMKLQTDPTIIYGKAVLTGKYELKISKADLLNESTPDNSYNTYVISGLPPGPISNPSKAALESVLNPAKSNYLYFVSRNDGTHVFSENYQNHQKAVEQFQLDPSAREGKSWRDLKNKTSVNK